MTAIAEPRTQVAATAVAGSRLKLGRVIRSEWIKFASLRSTWIAIGLTALVSLGITVLYASVMTGNEELRANLTPFDLVTGTLSGTMFTVLLAGIIGVIQVTGEYSTGAIRTTLTAAPDRTRALIAKYVVVGGFVFVASLAIFAVGAAISAIMFGGVGVEFDFADPSQIVFPVLWGATTMMTVAVIGISAGYLVRNGGGAVALVVGLTFVLPLAGGMFAMPALEWISEIFKLLPTTAGQYLMMGAGDETLRFGLALLGWNVVGIAAGAAALKLRDA